MGNEVKVVPGKQYLIWIYFHNNASATYNDAEHKNVGVAVNTRVSVSYPEIVSPEKSGIVLGTIKADNAQPPSVWDSAKIISPDGEIHLSYVSGSAKIYNDWETNGSIIPSSIFTEKGTLLGLKELNGIIPGCEEYHGTVVLRLQAK